MEQEDMQYVRSNTPWLSKDGFHADSFEELAQIGVAEILKLGPNVEIVCGPISTGGRGSAEENFKAFGASIKKLKQAGHNIFDQCPYEMSLGKLRQKWGQDPDNVGYCLPILTEFYHSLFATQQIVRAHFIPGWESSFGAQWEHAELTRLGVVIRYLKIEWIDHAIQAHT